MPVVVGTLSIAAGYVTGFFDEEYQRLQREKQQAAERLTLTEATLRGLDAKNQLLEAERKSLAAAQGDLREQNEALEVEITRHEPTLQEIQAKAVQFKRKASQTADQLETVLDDVNELFQGKQSLYRLVDELDMPPEQRQRLRGQFRRHLDTIRDTNEHASSIRRAPDIPRGIRLRARRRQRTIAVHTQHLPPDHEARESARLAAFKGELVGSQRCRPMGFRYQASPRSWVFPKRA